MEVGITIDVGKYKKKQGKHKGTSYVLSQIKKGLGKKYINAIIKESYKEGIVVDKEAVISSFYYSVMNAKNLALYDSLERGYSKGTTQVIYTTLKSSNTLYEKEISSVVRNAIYASSLLYLNNIDPAT